MENSHWIALDLDDITIEDARLEVEKMRSVASPVELGLAVIRKSSKGHYHIIFPNARVSRELEEKLMLSSCAHDKWIRYSLLVNDTTIRRGVKWGVEEPKIVEVIR